MSNLHNPHQISIRTFIEDLHELWLKDRMTLDVFIAHVETHMLIFGVKWVPVTTKVNEAGELIDRRMSAEDCFAYDINDLSKDRFENFESVCMDLMDFSQMVTIHGRAAA